MDFRDNTILERAHKHSSQHKEEILKSEKCGCFYCGSIFTPQEIKEWIDKDKNGVGQTALCPKCGIDAVIGESSELSVSNKEFLQEMHRYWFG